MQPPRLARPLGVLSLALCLAAAPSADGLAAAPPLPLARAHLGAYAATYRISGAASGSQTWRIRQGKGRTTDVTVTTRVARERETDRLVLTRTGLHLRSAQEKIAAPGASAAITATVKRGQVLEQAVVNGRHEHLTYPMGATTYVNQALLPTLSGLYLRSGERSVVHDVVLQHGGNAVLGLSVGRLSTIRTPAGAFRCALVTISSASGKQSAWVSVGRDPVLVRYANRSTTFTLTTLKR